MGPSWVRAETYLYTNNNEVGPSTVSAFVVNGAGGLTEVAGSPFGTGAAGYGGVGVYASQGLVVSPSGPFLFTADGGGCDAANANDGCVSAFAIDPTNGALTLVDVIPLPYGFNNSGAATSLAVTPDGSHLYAASYLAQVIYRMSVAPDGALTMDGLTYASFPFQDLRALAISPNGKYLAAGVGFDGVAMFGIGVDGNLTPVSGSPFPSTGGTAGIAFNASSDRLYAGQALFGVPIVDVFGMATDGVLSPLSGLALCGVRRHQLERRAAQLGRAIALCQQPRERFGHVL